MSRPATPPGARSSVARRGTETTSTPERFRNPSALPGGARDDQDAAGRPADATSSAGPARGAQVRSRAGTFDVVPEVQRPQKVPSVRGGPDLLERFVEDERKRNAVGDQMAPGRGQLRLPRGRERRGEGKLALLAVDLLRPQPFRLGGMRRTSTDRVRGLSASHRIHQSGCSRDPLSLPGPLDRVPVTGGGARPVRLAPVGLGCHDRALDKVRAERLGEGERERDGRPLLAFEVQNVGPVVRRVMLADRRGVRGRGVRRHAPCFEAVLR